MSERDDTHDSREKLEADVLDYQGAWPLTDSTPIDVTWGIVRGWLDRQAAITRHECKGTYDRVRIKKKDGSQITLVLSKKNSRVLANMEKLMKILEKRTNERHAELCEKNNIFGRIESDQFRKNADTIMDILDDIIEEMAIQMECEDTSCVECAEGMGRYADSLCDPLKQRIAELEEQRDVLLRCLENDYGIRASWDGLRRVWVTESVATKLYYIEDKSRVHDEERTRR